MANYIITGNRGDGINHITAEMDATMLQFLTRRTECILGDRYAFRLDAVGVNTVRMHAGQLSLNGYRAQIDEGNYIDFTFANTAQGMYRMDGIYFVMYRRIGETVDHGEFVLRRGQEASSKEAAWDAPWPEDGFDDTEGYEYRYTTAVWYIYIQGNTMVDSVSMMEVYTGSMDDGDITIECPPNRVTDAVVVLSGMNISRTPQIEITCTSNSTNPKFGMCLYGVPYDLITDANFVIRVWNPTESMFKPRFHWRAY